MFDTSRALADMANQIRQCRSSEGLTLQQLAARSGVAASTIHKVEARQMVPTVTVLLKIAKGLGRRPDELIRDDAGAPAPGSSSQEAGGTEGRDIGLGVRETRSPVAAAESASPRARPDVGVWELDLANGYELPSLDLAPAQRAIVLVQQGGIELEAGGQRVQMDAGDCIEIQGGRIAPSQVLDGSTRVMLIISPRGDLDIRLGSPSPSAPIFG